MRLKSEGKEEGGESGKIEKSGRKAARLRMWDRFEGSLAGLTSGRVQDLAM